jgi:uncharacterized protein YeaO (DUF488 family)
MIKFKRVYETPSSADGARFLVERLWPRGMNKSSLEIEAWLKDAAPSARLRKWFHHDPVRWNEFRRRYFTELKEKSSFVAAFLGSCKLRRRHADLQLS